MSDDKITKLTIETTASMRELVVLTMFLVNTVKPKDRKEQRQFNRVFDELNLDRFMSMSATKIDDLSTEQTPVVLSQATIEYIADVTNAEMAGPISRVLTRFVDRLIAAKDA